jgi:transcriptional regulator with XRE-family HTH domain
MEFVSLKKYTCIHQFVVANYSIKNLKKMSDKLFIAAFCKQTGLSKRNLAAFVGTDQSALSRFETGHRNLAPDALVLLAKLYKKASSIKQQMQPSPTPEDKQWRKQQAQWCQLQSKQLQKKLNTIIENYQQASTALQLLDTLTKEVGTFTEKKKRWVEEQRYQANKKLQKNGWLQQKKIAIQMQLHLQEAAAWQQNAVT